jgi:hypothetical protein
VDVVQVLGELGGSFDRALDDGATPAFVATQNGRIEILRIMGEFGADFNAAKNDGSTPLGEASSKGNEKIVRLLCAFGAKRSFMVTALAQRTGNMDVVRFLQRTMGFVNPLQYSSELTTEDAQSLLRSEKLRDFPPIPAFVNHGTPACELIESGLVWSSGVAELFPRSCRRRARELLFIRWPLPSSVLVRQVIPFVVGR